MATNLAIDDKLVVQAVLVGRHKTKKEAVNCALRAYIAHKKQTQIIDMFGTVDFDEKYDYKKARQR
jgi:Arc/MetJ family transcription regulator